ncbi:MAG TPA: ABC transporter permease subunit [Vicinamibacteria bacterium]|jgi:hypothetical protein|nr:ABC transporter permease subunit [Vicinamibacteria bacterium]
MAEMFRSTLRARGLRPAPLALAAFLVATATFLGWVDGGIDPLTAIVIASISTIVTSAGLIGSDVADGTVQLVLARPLTRNQYLAGRFLGAATLAVLAGVLILCGGTAGVWLRSGRLDREELTLLAITTLAHLLWQTTLCFALSTFAPGHGDVVAYLVLLVASRLLAWQASDVSWPWLAAAFHWWADQVENELTYSGFSLTFLQDLVRWLSNGAVTLLLGALVFRHRQFSYGAG